MSNWYKIILRARANSGHSNVSMLLMHMRTIELYAVNGLNTSIYRRKPKLNS